MAVLRRERPLRLAELLPLAGAERVVPVGAGGGDGACLIRGIACHPDDIAGPGTLFVAMDEFLEYNRWLPWHQFVGEVAENADVVAAVVPAYVPGWEVPQLVTAAPRRALGVLSGRLVDWADAGVWCCGVTGTNGKTTTVQLLGRALEALGERSGTLGTLGLYRGGERVRAGEYTTSLAPSLYGDLRELARSGVRSVAMEVSSHGLALERVAGLVFDAAVVTNLERDHLDFHGTVGAYGAAKRRLVERVKADGCCVLHHGLRDLAGFRKATRARVLTYGALGSGADVGFGEIEAAASGSRFTVCLGGRRVSMETPLAGRFQVENVCAVVALLWGRGYGVEAIAEAVAGFAGVCGRMERYRLPGGGTALVDYAHNPDGLAKVLAACRGLANGKLQVVFGCGGDRDRGKRPEMGALAARWAEVCWVTSDNPRTEDAGAIITDILEGMPAGETEIQVVVERAEAIRRAVAACGPDDLLLIAGKGHEDYQILGHRKVAYSDQGILLEAGAKRD